MKKFKISIFVSTLLFFSACNQSNPKVVCKYPNTLEPLSKQATLIESTNTGESIIKATGKGCNFEQATLDAKKAAVWYVLYAGDRPLLKTLEQKRKAKYVVEDILKHVDNYIRYISDVKSKQKIGGYVYLTYLVKVDVNALKEKLKEAGVIKDTEEIAEEIGLPTVAVLTKRNTPENQVAVTTLQEYLEDRGFEVYTQPQTMKLNSIIKKVAVLEGKVDPIYETALSLGSDVYIDVKSDVKKIINYGHTFYKATVYAKAYETATGKLLGASVGYSPAREVASDLAVVQEAANDVADKITSQIEKAWLKEAKKGKPFKIVVITSEDIADKVDEAIYYALKKLSKRPVKRLASGKSMFSYIAYIKGVPNAFELYMKLKKLYQGPGKIEKIMDSGSILIIKVTNSVNGDDVVVE